MELCGGEQAATSAGSGSDDEPGCPLPHAMLGVSNIKFILREMFAELKA